MLDTRYFRKIANINSQQKKQSVLIAKISSCKAQIAKISCHMVNHFLLIIINAAVL